METAETILYETLSPLGLTTTDEPQTTPSQPPSSPPSTSDETEPYVVFRNEISLSSIQSSSTETAAPDYFSLDVVDGVQDAIDTPVPIPKSPAAALVKEPEPERTIEGNWFRANCRFKSPMLQLHKGIFLSSVLSSNSFFLRFYFALMVIILIGDSRKTIQLGRNVNLELHICVKISLAQILNLITKTFCLCNVNSIIMLDFGHIY